MLTDHDFAVGRLELQISICGHKFFIWMVYTDFLFERRQSNLIRSQIFTLTLFTGVTDFHFELSIGEIVLHQDFGKILLYDAMSGFHQRQKLRKHPGHKRKRNLWAKTHFSSMMVPCRLSAIRQGGVPED